MGSSSKPLPLGATELSEKAKLGWLPFRDATLLEWALTDKGDRAVGLPLCFVVGDVAPTATGEKLAVGLNFLGVVGGDGVVERDLDSISKDNPTDRD